MPLNPAEDIFTIGLDQEVINNCQLYTGKDTDNWTNSYKGLWFPAFRQYNESLSNWLKGITLQKSNSSGKKSEVKVLYSTPERAYSKYIFPLVEGRADIPVIIFYITGMSFVQNRRFVPKFVGNYEKTNMGDYWRLSPKSLPYDLDYHVSCYCKHYYDADQIDWHILSRFQPSSYIFANGAMSPIKLTNFTEGSTEGAKDADRTIRRDYMLKVEAWCPLPYLEVSKIENIGIQMIVGTYNEEIMVE